MPKQKQIILLQSGLFHLMIIGIPLVLLLCF